MASGENQKAKHCQESGHPGSTLLLHGTLVLYVTHLALWYILHWGLFLFLCIGHFLSVLRPLVPRDWGSVCPLEFPIAGMALDLEVILHNVWQWWSVLTVVTEKRWCSAKDSWFGKMKKMESVLNPRLKGSLNTRMKYIIWPKGKLFRSNFKSMSWL